MNLDKPRPPVLLHVGDVVVETMLGLRCVHHFAHFVVQVVRGDPQHFAQRRAQDLERRRQHAQGQQDQDQGVDIHRPLAIALGLEQQRGQEADQQAHRQHRVHQPADVVELDQRRLERAVAVAHIEEVGELNDSKHRRINDHQPQLDLAPAIDNAEHAIEERVDSDQQQETAFDQQHHRLQVPIAELETLVAFLGDQLGRDQHQHLDGGGDQREKAVEQNGLGARYHTRDNPCDRHSEHQDGRLFEQCLLTSVTHISSRQNL